VAYIDALSELENFEDGSKPWADFVFDLVSVDIRKKFQSDVIEYIAFEMRGGHAEGDIGIKVSLSPTEWEAGNDPDLPLFWGKVTLTSSGEYTDRLVRLYESWWQLPTGSDKAASSIAVLAVGINSDPRLAATQKISTKLFFDPEREWSGEDEDPFYGELYLNFDLSARRGWLLEKDTGYRKQVVGWLTGQFRKPNP
jgi:hypothetical protein